MPDKYVPKLTRKEQERRRLAAGKELLESDPDDYGAQARIAEKYGVTTGAVSKWAKAAREGGLDALRGKTGAGRQPRLNDDEKEKLKDMLLEGATAHGYENDVWTGDRVARLIADEFDVEYNPKYMAQFLRDYLGFTWQKPSRRPRELDPEKLQDWMESTWEPAKKGRSKADGGSSSSTKAASS